MTEFLKPLNISEEYYETNLFYNRQGVSALLVDVDLINNYIDVEQVLYDIQSEYGNNVHLRFTLGDYNRWKKSEKLKEILRLLREALNVTITVSNHHDWYDLLYPEFVELVTVIRANAFLCIEKDPPDLTGCSRLEIIERDAFLALEEPPDLTGCLALRVIGDRAFFRLDTIPDLSQCGQLEYIGESSFASASGPLPDFTKLPNLEVIQPMAFYDLTTPPGVPGPNFSDCHKLRVIGDSAFYSITESPLFGACSSLVHIGNLAFASVRQTPDISKCTQLVNYSETSLHGESSVRTMFGYPSIVKNFQREFLLEKIELPVEDQDTLFTNHYAVLLEEQVVKIATKLWQQGKLPDIKKGDLVRRSYSDDREYGRVFFNGERFIIPDFVIDGQRPYDYPALPPSLTYPEYSIAFARETTRTGFFYASFTSFQKKSFLQSFDRVPQYIIDDLNDPYGAIINTIVDVPYKVQITPGVSGSILIFLLHNGRGKNIEQFLEGNLFRCCDEFHDNYGKPEYLELFDGFSRVFHIEAVPMPESVPRDLEFKYTTALSGLSSKEYLDQFDLFLEDSKNKEKPPDFYEVNYLYKNRLTYDFTILSPNFFYPDFSIEDFIPNDEDLTVGNFNARITLLQKEIYLEEAKRSTSEFTLLREMFRDLYRNIGPFLVARSGPYIVVVGEIYKSETRVQEPPMSPEALLERFFEDEVFLCGFQANNLIPVEPPYTIISVHVGLFPLGIYNPIPYTSLFGRDPEVTRRDDNEIFYKSFSLAEKELFLEPAWTFPDEVKQAFLSAYRQEYGSKTDPEYTVLNDSGSILVLLVMPVTEFLSDEIFKCEYLPGITHEKYPGLSYKFQRILHVCKRVIKISLAN